MRGSPALASRCDKCRLKRSLMPPCTFDEVFKIECFFGCRLKTSLQITVLFHLISIDTSQVRNWLIDEIAQIRIGVFYFFSMCESLHRTAPQYLHQMRKTRVQNKFSDFYRPGFTGSERLSNFNQ